ncbi:MAG: hypothetical protein DRO12_03305 [Thermoprotei archaeon]|nr:MAG: hypothetical protein DRO12_03305 [Thermoprotei archaeon]
MAKMPQLAALRRIAQEAFREAAHSISTFVGSDVKLKLISLEILPPLQYLEVIGGQDSIVAAAYSTSKGEWSGIMLIMMPLEYASKTVSSLVKSFLGQSEISEELAVETFKEFANIIFGSIATVLYNKAGIKIMFSPPEIAVDSAVAIMESIAVTYSTQFDELLLFRAEIEGEKIHDMTLLVIPGQGFVDMLHGAEP